MNSMKVGIARRISPRVRSLVAALLCVVASSSAYAQDLAGGGPSRSIREWAQCGEGIDNTDNVRRAFQASSAQHFTLVVDCPIFLNIGTDITRPIFVGSNTSVAMSPDGEFIVNNIFVPAFVLANSNNITFQNWHIEFRARVPVNPDVGGYYVGGRFIAKAGRFQPAYAFNDDTLTSWLGQNRGLNFVRSTAPAKSPWNGPTNTSAVIFMIGDVHDVVVRGLKFTAPQSASPDQLIPVCIQTSAGYIDNEAVERSDHPDPTLMAVPHRLVVQHLYIDGAYMGWVGNLQDTSITYVHSVRYGDMQNADGTDLGGVGKWFAPPHLFYLSAGNSPIHNRNIVIRHVIDDGQRLGSARDQSGEKLSGYAASLKIGADNSLVEDYVSYRPDGLLDVTNGDGLTFLNVRGTYNSNFTHGLYPGLRFPGSGYRNIRFDGLHLEDLAATTSNHVVWGVNLRGQVRFFNSTLIIKKVTAGVDVVPKEILATSPINIVSY